MNWSNRLQLHFCRADNLGKRRNRVTTCRIGQRVKLATDAALSQAGRHPARVRVAAIFESRSGHPGNEAYALRIPTFSGSPLRDSEFDVA
jgi:hypothetical protein